MFTDKELEILETDIFPVVIKYNDPQKVVENLDEEYIDLFLKGYEDEYKNEDISEIVIGTFGKEENNVLYLRGNPRNGYKKYKGGGRPWSVDITKTITETKILLPKSCPSMFRGCTKIEKLDVSKGDTSKVEDMGRMFCGCENLEKLDVSNGNVSKVENMFRMFDGCAKLEFLNVSNGNVSRVKNMCGMFAGCASLEELDVSNGDVSKVEDMYNMFNNCANLEKLDVSNGDVSNVRDMDGMFQGCENLIELKGILNGDLSSLKHFKFMFTSTSDFKDKDKILQKFGVK